MRSVSPVPTIHMLLGETVGDFFYAPVWWYSRGFLRILRAIGSWLVNVEMSLGLRMWLKNIGTPMYGQYDTAGRIISLLMRLAILFVRTVGFLCACVMALVVVVLWLALPIVVLWQIGLQILALVTPR